jgi:hypothetical protein
MGYKPPIHVAATLQKTCCGVERPWRYELGLNIESHISMHTFIQQGFTSKQKRTHTPCEKCTQLAPLIALKGVIL